MKNSKIVVFFILLLLTLSVSAQVKTFNRARTFDIQNYLIRISFERESKTVFGETTVSLKPLRDGFRTFELDAANLQFESVQLDAKNKTLQFRTTENKVFVTLDKMYSAKDLIAVRFKYKTMDPAKGIYFVDAEKRGGKVTRDAQIWTQGETEEAHYWFPSYDFPDDKATTEQFLTVQGDEIAIGNGEQMETTDNADGTKTFHFKMSVPYSTYLVSFVIGKYVKVTDSYKNIPLGFYVYPGRESTAEMAFGKTKMMMQIFEELTGVPFQYNKYDQTIVANFNFGGMENMTATTLADTEVFLVETGFGRNIVEDLVSHELAHSWFGDLVTCRNWSELWLNEGFATFMEAAYREKMYNREIYMGKIRSDTAQYLIDEQRNRNRHGLVNQLARPDDSIFDTTTYQKGGVVIHTLRETVGDENFWKAINIYLNRHKFGNVETPDLQKAMEEVSKMDLNWFFKQWIYGAGYPKLNVKPVYNPTTKTLQLTITQTQKLDAITPAAFVLPMDVEITTPNGVKTEKLNIRKRLEVISIKLDGNPSDIQFDKDFKIPLKEIKLQPIL